MACGVTGKHRLLRPDREAERAASSFPFGRAKDARHRRGPGTGKELTGLTAQPAQGTGRGRPSAQYRPSQAAPGSPQESAQCAVEGSRPPLTQQPPVCVCPTPGSLRKARTAAS